MKKGPIIIGVILLIVIIAIIVLFLGKSTKYNWQETYQVKSDQPYGLNFLYESLLKSVSEDNLELTNKSITRVIDSTSSGIYFAIGNQLYYNNEELDTLFHFVERGNQAFLSSNYLSYNIQKRLFKETADSFLYSSDIDTFRVHLNFLDKELEMDSSFTVGYEIIDTVHKYSWARNQDELYNTDSLEYEKLGYFGPGDNINFLKIKYGKGEFLIHSTPIAFTNFHFKKTQGFEYTNKVLSYLDDGKIYWDLASLVYSGGNYWGNSNLSKGPLTYLLSIQSMKWAWYLIIALVGLYALFNLKRKQRIIPLVEKNTNSSLAYIETIGGLYFNTKNHKKIALKEMELFLFHVRKRYGINTSKLDEEFEELLASKAEVRQNLIHQIIEKYRAVEYLSDFSDEMLIAFHQLLEQFYKTSK